MGNTAEMWRAFWAGFVVWPVLIATLFGLAYGINALRDKWIGDRIAILEEKLGNIRMDNSRLEAENEICIIALRNIRQYCEREELTGEAPVETLREISERAGLTLVRVTGNFRI